MILGLACLHFSLFQHILKYFGKYFHFCFWSITVICNPWIKTWQCFTFYTHILTAFVDSDRGERLLLPAWNVLHIARWNLILSSQNSISLGFFSCCHSCLLHLNSPHCSESKNVVLFVFPLSYKRHISDVVSSKRKEKKTTYLSSVCLVSTLWHKFT